MDLLRSNKVLLFLVLATFIFGEWALYSTFMVVPSERVMGAVQRIFYFHVGSAFAAYVSVFFVFVASLGFLSSSRPFFDIVNAAAGRLGFVFCSIVLVTGMIWGSVAWNTPFRAEPRLLSFLLLWWIFFSFVLLRIYGDRERMASHSAVLGIVGTLCVPVMIYSIKLLPQISQLHPQVIEHQGLRDPSMMTTLLVSSAAMILLQLTLLVISIRIEVLEQGKKYDHS